MRTVAFDTEILYSDEVKVHSEDITPSLTHASFYDKSRYAVRNGHKSEITDLLNNFHYLSVKNLSRGFRVGHVHVLQHDTDGVVGVCIYTNLPVPELLVGCFGLPRSDHRGFFELSRLCIHPDHQQPKSNLTSWFVSRSLKQLTRDVEVRAVLSYADAGHHSGTIYAACNFKYYGLSTAKKDFFQKMPDGSFKKVSRGRISDLEGEWRPRTQKHRFLMTYDKSLVIRWPESKWRKSA